MPWIVHLHLVCNCLISFSISFFFFNDTATTEIYTLSLHDALPISGNRSPPPDSAATNAATYSPETRSASQDRKSTRLNSSHTVISYAVFCLKKKKKTKKKTKIKNIT